MNRRQLLLVGLADLVPAPLLKARAEQKPAKRSDSKSLTYEYNGVLIESVSSIQISSTSVEYDAEWNLYRRYTIRVTGFLPAKANTLDDIKRRLETPRRPFRYGTSSQTWLEQSTPDAMNGPLPGPTTVTEVASGIAMVDTSVELTVPFEEN